MTVLTQKIKSDEIISDLFFATSFSSPCWPNEYSDCKIFSLIGWLIFLFACTATWAVLLETLFIKPGNIMACVDFEKNNLPAVLFMHPAVRSALCINVQTAVGSLDTHHRAPTPTVRSRSVGHQPSRVTRLNRNHQCFISLLYFYELDDGKLSSYVVFTQTWKKN